MDQNLSKYLTQNAYQLGANGQATGRYFVNDNQGTSHEIQGANAGHFQALGVDPNAIRTVDQFSAPRTAGSNFGADQLATQAGQWNSNANTNNALQASNAAQTAANTAMNAGKTPPTAIPNDPNLGMGGLDATGKVVNRGSPTLANGQQAGGLEMPSGDAANSVFDPVTGKQVSPAEAAFNATKASGTPAPQDSSSASGTVKTAIDNATPPDPAATTTPGVENFYNSNKSIQQNAQELQNYFSPPEQQKQLQDQLAKITTDQNTLAGLNTQLMNVKNIMNGTEDDIRKEIQAAGGIGTNSQILALTTARNKNLLQNATLIQNSIDTASQAISNDMSLLAQEKEMANTQFSQRTQTYKMAQDNYNSMIQAQKDSANTIIQAIGYKGYLDNLQAQGPTAVANAEKALGLGVGGLQNLVTQQQQQQNANAIANSGATTPFVNKNGEIQSQTGYAYTSEQDFFNKTGMIIQQAQDKGMISAFQPPLDTQLKKAQVGKAQADLANAPLETQKLQAEIAHTKAETSKVYGDMAKAAQAEQAVDPAVLQGMLNVYKTTGVLPPFGLSGKSPLRTQFFAALGGAGGQDLVSDANTNKAVLQGLKTAYSTQQNQYTANQTAIGTLDKQLDLAKIYSDKVSRSDSPFIAKYQNSLKSGVFGDPDTAAFNNIVKTASAEFAKILSGSSASISGATVSSQADAEKLLNTAMSKGQFNSVMDLMKKEAQFRLSTQQGTINDLQTQIGNIGKPPEITTGSTGTLSGSSIQFKILP